MPVTLETIRAARQRIDDVIYHSACNYSLSLSRLCNAEIYCKLDHLQVTGSFKERGARNKLKLLKESHSGLGGAHDASSNCHSRDQPVWQTGLPSLSVESSPLSDL